MDDLIILQEVHTPRSDAVKNRALLLDTARRLFDEQGVEAVTMSAIAEAAAVGKGTLYRHFENKAVLCLAMLDLDQRDLQQRSLERFRSHHDPLGNLRWFLVEAVTFVERNSAFLCVIASVQAMNSLQSPAHVWWRQTIRGLLEQMNIEIDLDYATDVLYVMLDVHVLHFQRTVQGYDTPRILSGLTAVMLQLTK